MKFLNKIFRNYKLFYIFDSQEERKKCGGTSFMEMQFCKLRSETKIEELVSVGNISHWQKDSLYIRDEIKFIKEYGNIFDCGIYNNLKTGEVDICGINYYEPRTIDIIKKELLIRNQRIMKN